jgi:hypothetical protein
VHVGTARISVPGIHPSAETLEQLVSEHGNRVNDFWTGNVKGLYTMTSAKVRGARGDREDPPIRLIELSVAAADMDGGFVPAGGENMDLGRFTTPGAYCGHWFLALEADHSLLAGDPHHSYQADTGGLLPMGPCHNMSRFAFIAVPVSSWTGKYIFGVNENNSIFRRVVTGEIWNSHSVPPGRGGLPAEYRNWPDDENLKQHWGQYC